MTESLGTFNIGGKDLPVEIIDGRRAVKDAEGNVFILGPSDSAPKKPSAMDEKRRKIYLERRQRAIGKGVSEDKVDQVLAEEDYRALPIDKKLERFILSVNQAFRALAGDIQTLQSNNNIIADAFDVNLRAIAICFEKLGLSKEDQGAIIASAVAQAEEERKAAQEAKKLEDATKSQVADLAKESAMAEASLRKAEGRPELIDEEGAPAPIPDGATTFGD